MSDLCIANIYKTFNPGLFKKKIYAVNNLTFDVFRGEVFGLVGPNGAGKSTTIRILLGLVRPNSGSVLFRGKPLAGAGIQKEIGYLPENPYLYDHLNLLELLAFCGQTSGLDVKSIARRGQMLMSKLHLLDVQKRPLRTFSKGMAQRAGICFALLHDPSIVILDEPMSGLDPIGRKMVFDLVMDLKREGKTIFFCSHILNDVERLCDRIGLVDQGRLVRLFKREDFLQHTGKTVFLQVGGLESVHRQELAKMGGLVRDDNGAHLLAIPEGCYYQMNSYLHKSGVDILGCRSEWLSLEDLFMQIIKERRA
jgi:ABC-2 type transport system ATP-binding protein